MKPKYSAATTTKDFEIKSVPGHKVLEKIKKHK